MLIGKVKEIKVDNLSVRIYPAREMLGFAAARDASSTINNLQQKKDTLRIIFAAAPSQNEFLAELVRTQHINWQKIIAFHMDEYIGLDKNSPHGFGKFLSERIFDKVPFKKVHYINSEIARVDKSCEEYASLLREEPIDIVFMGIGENGHIAFNDPPFADFSDPKWVKVVELDEMSRQQQVNDKCFDKLGDVPKKAITLTISALMSANHLFIVVPGQTKANAVKVALYGSITEKCPASILRKHSSAKLYLDVNSAAYLK